MENKDATLLCGVEAWILMKTQPPPEPHTQLPQAGEGLQVQEAGFTFGRTQPQQGQETLAGAWGNEREEAVKGKLTTKSLVTTARNGFLRRKGWKICLITMIMRRDRDTG